MNTATGEVLTGTMEPRLRAARAKVEEAKREHALVTTRVRDSRAALEKAEREEDYVLVSDLKHELDEAIEAAADVQAMDRVANAEDALNALRAEERAASLAAYRPLAERLLRAAEELHAAWRAEVAWRQGRHGGLKSSDFLPAMGQASLLPSWLQWARRRLHDVFSRGK